MNDKSSVSSHVSSYVKLFHLTVMLCITVALFCAERIDPACLYASVCVCCMSICVFVTSLRVSPSVIRPFLYRLSMSNI